MTNRLLDRQTSLLDHLTSGAAVFGDAAVASTAPGRLGIDAGLLCLEARFSHQKRMEKIEWVLPRTFELLGTARDVMVRDFVEACPPVSIGWLANAHQFHDFLTQRWRDQAPEPAHLPDLAACELAYASLYGRDKPAATGTVHASPGRIRRHPAILLVRCRHNVLSILEGRGADAPVAQRDTPLAMSMAPGAEHPTMSELSPDLFEFLELLDDFVDLMTTAGLPDLNDLIADLSRRGFLEVQA
jgi:hypothetical protein